MIRRKLPSDQQYNYVRLPPVILNLDRPDHCALLKKLVAMGIYRPTKKRKTVGYGRLVRRLLARHLNVTRSDVVQQAKSDPMNTTDDLAAAYAWADWQTRDRA